MMKRSDDTIKINLIKELVPLADPSVASALLDLLKNEATFKPQVREKLLLIICQALGYCNSANAIAPLEQFRKEYRISNNPLTPDVQSAIRLSLEQLKLSAGQIPEEPIVQPPPVAAEELPSNSPVDIPEAQLILSFIKKGQKPAAIDQLMELIKKYTSRKQFKISDRLRNWLIEIDSMALSHIVRQPRSSRRG